MPFDVAAASTIVPAEVCNADLHWGIALPRRSDIQYILFLHAGEYT